MFKRLNIVLIICFLLGVFSLGLLAGKEKKPFRVGYVAAMSGRNAELGQEGCRGVELAVAEINRAGGVAGHPVELIIEDNRGDAEGAWDAVGRLLKQEADVLIGHMTSEMSVTSLNRLEGAGVVMISPTSSSDKLEGLDDQFLRIYPTASVGAAKISEYIANYRQLDRVAVIYDKSNGAYGSSWAEAFSQNFATRSGASVVNIPYNGDSPEASFTSLVQQVYSSHADGILMLTNPYDSAMICQQVAKLGGTLELFAGEWSNSPVFWEMAGKTADEVVMFQTIHDQDTSKGFTAFRTDFKKAYGSEPWFASIHSYDATKFALAGLRRNSDASQLKKTLLDYGVFQGVQAQISLDGFGDADRTVYVEQFSRQTMAHLIAML